MARLYANENFPFPVVEHLRQLGHDVETTYGSGKDNQAIPDEEVLEYAIRENRAVLTLNRKDFIRLHRSDPQHAGIVACTFDPDFAAQAHRIHEAIVAQGALDNQLVRVNRTSP